MISGTSAISAILLLAQALQVGPRRHVGLVLAGQEVLACVSIAAGSRRSCAGHLGRRQLDVEDLQVVDETVLEAAVAKAGADRQRMRVRRAVAGLAPVVDVLVEVVANDFGLERRAVEIEGDARRAARSVVGHDKLRPFVQRQWASGAHRDGVARPEMDERRRTAGRDRASARSRGCRRRSTRATDAGRRRDPGLRSAGGGRSRRTGRCGRTSARRDGRPGCRR